MSSKLIYISVSRIAYNVFFFFRVLHTASGSIYKLHFTAKEGMIWIMKKRE